MASLAHEALVDLFRQRPELAPELLRDTLHVPIPAYSEVRIESADLTDIAPTEYRADLVVLLVDGVPVLGVVIEVQLREDERKRFTWPAYAANLRARFECPTSVLVITPNERVAAWARTPVDVGAGWSFVPLVLGPSAIPVVRDVATAVRSPELAVLSSMAHGRGPAGIEVGIATLTAIGQLDGERADLFWNIVCRSSNDAVRDALEDLMDLRGYVPDTELGKKFQEMRRVLRAAGEAEGRAAGEAEGRAAGEAEGRAAGEASAILKVLEARGVDVTLEQRDRILACTDLSMLDAWVRGAVSVACADDLFVD